MAVGRTTQVRVCREAVLGFCHANGKVAETIIFPLLQLVTHFLVGQHLIGAVDALCDGFDLGKQRHVVGVKRLELRHVRIGDFRDAGRKIGDASGTICPVLAEDGF